MRGKAHLTRALGGKKKRGKLNYFNGKKSQMNCFTNEKTLTELL